MPTEIQPVPDVVLASEFPSLADRTANTYNTKAKAWADSENAMATRTREIALTAQNNATVAKESAEQAVTVAVPAAAAAVDARDAAQDYRDSAAAIAAAVGSEAGLPSMVDKDGQVLTVLPGAAAAGWMMPPSPEIPVVTITDDYAITPANKTNLIRFTGVSDVVLTFPPASQLPNGWYCYVKNQSDADLLMQGEEIGPELVTDGAMENIIGANVVVNGDFSTGGDWTSTGGWSISAGAATAVSSNGDLFANVDPLVVGKWYKVTYTVVSRSAGGVRVRLGEMQGIDRIAAGTYTEMLQCVGNASLRFQGLNFSGSIDNVTVEPYQSWELATNVLANPTFDNGGEGWVVSGAGANVSFVEGAASFDGGTSPTLTQTGRTENGVQYRLSFTVSDYSGGEITPRINIATGGTAVSANGDYVHYITAGSNSAAGLRFDGTSNFRGKISNVVLSRRAEFSAIPITYNAVDKEINFNALPVTGWGGLSQPIGPLIPGDIYELTYTVKNWSSGGVVAVLGLEQLQVRSGNGTFTQRFVADSSWSQITFAANTSAFSGSIANVSLKRVSAKGHAPDADATTAPWKMYPNEMRLFHSDGQIVRSLVMNSFSKKFTQSDVWLKPPGYSGFKGLIWEGGASGTFDAYSPELGPSHNGAKGGDCVPFEFPYSYLSNLEEVVVGAGGPRLTGAVRQTGITGGSSRFGSVSSPMAFDGAAIAPSGLAFYLFTASAAAAAAAPANSITSSYFRAGLQNNYSSNIANQIAVYGGGSGGVSTSTSEPRKGGRSIHGGNGGAGGLLNTSEDGQDGEAPGGGGGSVAHSTAFPFPTRHSGAGARGEVRVEGII